MLSQFFFLQMADVMSRAADGISAVQEIDFSSLCSQLGPLPVVCAPLPFSFLCQGLWFN